VGGGVSGLSCALTVAAAGLRVRVLEARFVGGGASGRNGGFAVRGPAIPYVELRDSGLMRLTEEALERMSALAGTALRRTGILYVAATAEEVVSYRGELDALVADGFRADWVERDELPAALRPRFLAGLRDPTGGALEPGRWVHGLAAQAATAGVMIAERTRARAVTSTGVETERGRVEASHVVVATDGYTDPLVPELVAMVTPARAQMLATEPLAERVFDSPVGARRGWDYWQQLSDGRLVAGGCRDAELGREFTSVDEPTPTIQARIEAYVERVTGRRLVVTHRWAGLLGLTSDRLPLVGRVPGRENIWCAAGYSGHGNVLALACGDLVARAILGNPDCIPEQFDPGRSNVARAAR
jgi:glycine/D-amino acid oxidase-like deaminating enzyme